MKKTVAAPHPKEYTVPEILRLPKVPSSGARRREKNSDEGNPAAANYVQGQFVLMNFPYVQ
jgi:hypothetical protein